jgi:hypothetical protein
MKYVRDVSVRQLAKANGKRVSPSFLLWLDGKVERLITEQCNALGSVKKTLNLEDSAKFDGFFRRR